MDGMLTIVTRRHLGHVLVTVAGEVDIATAPELRARLAEPAAEGRHVIVDLSQVRFVDVAGLRVLATAALEAAAHGGSLQVAGARSQLRRMLAIIGMDGHIPLTETVAEAREALRPGPAPAAIDACEDQD